MKKTMRVVPVFVLLLLSNVGLASPGEARFPWLAEWERWVAAAEREGQVTVYGPPGRQYQEAISSFQESFPRVRLSYLGAAGRDLGPRLSAERRAGKYLADAYVGGAATAVSVLFRGGMLDPISPVLLLPEDKDPSLWFNKKHQYADPDNEYVFIFAGNASATLGAYNTKLVKPGELKSYWDLLNPKWKGKILAFDPRARGHHGSLKGIYHNPALGGEFLRRLFSEMAVTTAREQTLMLNWLATGKFHIFLFIESSLVEDAKRQGLPVEVVDVPPAEGRMSSGWGHLGIINRAPHPNAARVFVNWMLSREGQLQWQKKSDDNSLRVDIPKDMLTDPRSVPKEGGGYILTSLPQYEDVTPIIKVIDDALTKAGKK